ncbi:MAG: YDG domain-containing protein, partial [Coriobacteriales bacterium]
GGSGSVTISGGVVTATSTDSAGIGGGDAGGSGNVTISGGVVTATSTDSAGIGGGDGVSISGNAVVFASTKATDPNSKAISDTSGKAENASNPWSGVIFENGQGAVYGSSAIEPTESFTIPAGKTLTIESGKKLAIASGKALVNEGTINNSGSIANSGLFVDFGTSDISPETGRVITKPQAASSLVYGGQAQALAQESASSAGYIQYKLGQDGSWSKEIPTATDHGEYTVYYQAVNSSGQAISSEFPLSASIAQREVGIQWGSTSLTYTGQAQAPTATATNAVDSDAIALTVEGAQTDVSANAYTATVTAITGDKAANYKLPAATTTSFTIGKAASGLTTAPAARTDLVYSGSAQELVSAGAATGGTMQYKLGGSGSWSAEVPTATAASTYTVYYYVKGDANHEDSQEGCVSVTIAKAAPSVTPPAANRQLTYSGSAQELVTAGSSADGTMQYSLDGTVWSTDLPAETNAGTYTVLYKVVGDSNHASIDPTPIEVTIAKKAVTVSGITAAGKTYDGTTGATLSFAGVIIDGKVGNDSLGVTATGTFADANAGDNKQVDITGIALEGDAAGNYVLAETGQQTKASASINRKEVTATITAGGGTYAGTITPAGATLNGVVSGDSVPVTLTYTGSANDGTPYNSTTAPSLAGSYTVTASISDANYKLTGTANAAFTIAKASTSVGIAASKDKLSGGGSVTLAVDSSQLPLGAQASVSCSDASIAVTPNGDGTFTASLPNATKDYTFTASYSGDDNHNEASGSCAVAVTQYIPPAPTYTVPVTGEDSVEVKATVSGSTAVVGEISVKALEGAVAGGEDGEAAATVTIDLSGLPKGVTQAQLSKSSVDKLLAVVSDAGNAVESVTVNLGGAVLTLDAKALAAVAGQVKGGNVTLGVAESEADSLNSAQQQALSPFTVVQLY